jgi:16S rRNA (adenine1518-N6/adenine1519-N6)-dimethyltransferase
MKKKLGQHFLIDKNVAKREVEFANIINNDVVLEIGPGMGILTKILAEKAKKVIAIEIDENLVSILRKSLPDNVEVICSDALSVSFEKLPRFNKIVSNLPFQISSPITFKLLDYDYTLAVLIYQKEFADRLIAETGTKHYSRLSVGVYYRTKCELLETISRDCFEPSPNVDSCIIRLTPKKFPPFFVVDEKFFFDLTKNLFNHRRKKIKTTLNEIYQIKLINLPYLNRRIEELSPEQIGELSNILFKLQNS